MKKHLEDLELLGLNDENQDTNSVELLRNPLYSKFIESRRTGKTATFRYKSKVTGKYIILRCNSTKKQK